MELEHLEDLKFSLDSVTIRSKVRMGYLPKLNLLYLHNENPKKIDFYDFNNQIYVKTIELSEIDLNRARDRTMIHVVSPDSIFVFDQTTNSLILYTDEGNKVNYNIKILDNDKENYGIMPWSYFYQTYLENFLFGVTIREKSTNSTKASPILSFSESTRQKTFYGNWPQSYSKDNQMAFAGPSFLEVDSNIVISMSYSDELQIISSNGDSIKNIYAGSNLMRSYHGKRDKSGSIEESIRHQLTNSVFKNLLYDKSSGYLIREGSIGLSIPDDVNPMSGQKFPSQNDDEIYFVLIVIDPDKGKIGEIHGPSLGNDAFSTNDGIFIQDKLSDPKNEDILIIKKMIIK